jgi:opacity protein-like surface antigen
MKMFKNVQKAFILVMAMLLAATTVHAQKQGDMAVGGNLNVITGDGFTNFGIGATFRYNILDPLRAEGGLAFYLGSNNMSYWDLSFNAHWLFPITDKFTLYPIGGFGLFGWKIKERRLSDVINGFPSVPYSGTDFALNLGGGAEYSFTDNLSGNFEIKYKIVDWDKAMFTVGIHYKF